MRTGYIVILVLCCPALALPESSRAQADEELPSEAFLEFLGDLEPLDDETWQLLERHALKDVAENKEVSSE